VDLDEVRELIELRERKRAIKGSLDEVDARIKFLTPRILDEFSRSGVQRITVDGRTIYQTAKVWVSRAEGVLPDDFHDLLREEGLGSLVKEGVNSQTISAWYREQRDLGEPIPDRLAEALKVSEVSDLGVRKAD